MELVAVPVKTSSLEERLSRIPPEKRHQAIQLYKQILVAEKNFSKTLEGLRTRVRETDRELIELLQLKESLRSLEN